MLTDSELYKRIKCGRLKMLMLRAEAFSAGCNGDEWEAVLKRMIDRVNTKRLGVQVERKLKDEFLSGLHAARRNTRTAQ
jgi:hypothetical protein